MSRYVLGHDAAFDLEAIWEFIAQDKPDAADRWIGKLFDAFDRLAASPGIGHQRQDLTSRSILFWPVGEYVILYRIAESHIEIVAITQGSRDIPGFLSHRKP
jgi:plasmid stabilization system protein ParE